jgi:hypothetical protein
MIGFRFLFALLPFLILLPAARPAAAETPPSPLGGRVAAVDGPVTLSVAGGSDRAWTDSERNDPLAAGMAVRTEAQGRALLQIGADAIALAPGTEIAFDRLDSGGTRMVLRRGRVGVRLSRLDAARKTEVMLPAGGVSLTQPGRYDIAAGDEHAPGRVAVFDGEARFAGKAGNRTVTNAKAATSANDEEAATADDFDRWWRSVDHGDAGRQALNYVSAMMTGFDALDANGEWQQVAGYGAVWFPTRVAADWAPYRFGHWQWVRPWGWTWIDDAAWGFAPSHFGRWLRVSLPGKTEQHWGWSPGEHIADPLYVPAAVAFIGTVGVGLSYPNSSGPAIAWFALAPGEPYWPGYPADLAAIRRMNQGEVPDLDGIGPAAAGGGPPVHIVERSYQNRRFATVVPRAVFVGGRPVAPALVQLPERRLENAPLLAGSPQIPPAPPASAPVVAAASAKPHAKAAVQTLVRVMKPRGPVRAARRPVSRLVHLAVITRRSQAWRRHVVSAALSRRGVHRASQRRLGTAHRR